MMVVPVVSNTDVKYAILLPTGQYYGQKWVQAAGMKIRFYPSWDTPARAQEKIRELKKETACRSSILN